MVDQIPASDAKAVAVLEYFAAAREKEMSAGTDFPPSISTAAHARGGNKQLGPMDPSEAVSE